MQESAPMTARQRLPTAPRSQFRLIDLLFLIGGVGVSLGFSRWLLGR